MEKRKSTGAGHDHRDDKAAANKKVKVADDNKAEAVANKGLGLLGRFPAELRDDIYELALQDLRAAPTEEWDFFKTDFRTFRSLLTVSKQVSWEVKGVFNVVAKDMTVYTDNVPKIYDVLKASQRLHPVLASAFFKICTPNNDGEDPYNDNPHWFGVDAMIASQQAWSNRAHHEYTPYDIRNLDATYGLDRWYWLPDDDSPGSSGWCDDGKTVYGFFGPDVTAGVTYENYENKKEKWRRIVIQGCFGDIKMDTRANIDTMRAHVEDVERSQREQPEEFKRPEREHSDYEEY